jgi:hypothetical protein
MSIRIRQVILALSAFPQTGRTWAAAITFYLASMASRTGVLAPASGGLERITMAAQMTLQAVTEIASKLS